MMRQQTRLQVESLESRQLLAVNVFLNEETNTVVVQGDDQADKVEIFQSGNQLVVKARGGTGLSTEETGGTFETNGRARLDVEGQFNLVVDLDGGNDTLVVRNISDFEADEPDSAGLGNAILETGDGDDRIGLQKVKGDNIAIDAGDGRNAVGLLKVEASNTLAISAGDGNDRVGLAKVKVGDDDAAGDAGDPTVDEFVTEVTGANLFDGAADIFGTTAGLSVQTAGGNDRVGMIGVRVGDNDATAVSDLLVDTGAGDDRVGIAKSKFEGAVDVLLGEGNDALGVIGSEFAGVLTADGGEGTDSALIRGNEFDGPEETSLITTNFERSSIRKNEFDEGDDDGDDDDDDDDEDERGRRRGGRGRR